MRDERHTGGFIVDGSVHDCCSAGIDEDAGQGEAGGFEKDKRYGCVVIAGRCYLVSGGLYH